MTAVEFLSLPEAGVTADESFDVQIELPSSAVPVDVVIEASFADPNIGNFETYATIERQYDVDLGGERTKTLTIDTSIPTQTPYDLRVVATFDGTQGTETAQATTTIGAAPSPEPETGVTRSQSVEITPRIGPVEPIVMEAKYNLPWQRNTNQTACGDTIQNQNGDLDWRIVFRGVVSRSQLQRLTALRDSSGSVETRTAAYGVKNVTFDELQVSRNTEQGVGEIDGTVEPLYDFQLQTKELEDDEGLFN